VKCGSQLDATRILQQLLLNIVFTTVQKVGSTTPHLESGGIRHTLPQGRSQEFDKGTRGGLGRDGSPPSGSRAKPQRNMDVDSTETQ